MIISATLIYQTSFIFGSEEAFVTYFPIFLQQ